MTRRKCIKCENRFVTSRSPVLELYCRDHRRACSVTKPMTESKQLEGQRDWACRNCERKITVWGEPLHKCLSCRSMDWVERD